MKKNKKLKIRRKFTRKRRNNKKFFYFCLNNKLRYKIYKILTIFILCSLYYITTNNGLIQNLKDYIPKPLGTINNKIIKFHGRIFIIFLYNNEAEFAYIYLWRLYNYVDRFLFMVSNETFTGLPKNITFSPYEKDIEQYMNKVDIVYFDNVCNKKEYPTLSPIWCFENSQRDYAKIHIEKKYNPNEEDLIIVVDVDEILTREGIEYIKKHPPKNLSFIKGSMYYPYYYHKVRDWNFGYVIRYNKNMPAFTKIRTSDKINPGNTLKYYYNPFKPLITHCSFCFKDMEQYKNKLNSFSHQEYNKSPYITNNLIFKSHYCRQRIDSIPGHEELYEGWKHLIPDDQRLKFLIDRSFEYPLELTNYTEKDLETMCERKFNRTPFD